MSMLIENHLIPEELDRRIKIRKEEHPYIIKQWAEGKAIRAIARDYKVDHRTIQFIIFPERLAANYQKRLALGGSKRYYKKDEWRETMREHRQYKNKLLKQKKLISK